MIGVPIYGPALVFFDKKSVVTNTSVPTSNFSKKHLGICYYALREAVAAGICRILHITVRFNPEYVITKLFTAAVKRPHITQILY